MPYRALRYAQDMRFPVRTPARYKGFLGLVRETALTSDTDVPSQNSTLKSGAFKFCALKSVRLL